MFKKYSMVFTFVLVAALLMNAVLPTVSADELEGDEVSIVQAYYEALNAGDVDTAMTFIADDAVFSNPMGLFSGSEEITASLVEVVNEQITFRLDNFFVCNGRVVYDYEVFVGGSSVEIGNNGLTIVQGGKITFDGTLATEQPPHAPEAVYRAAYDAINAGDIETLMTFIADNAVAASPDTIASGKAEVQAFWEEAVAAGLTFELTRLEVEGNRIYSSYRVLQDGSEIDAGDDGLAIIEDGWIVYDGFVTGAPQPPTDPSGVVEAYYTALNAGDLDTAMSYIADDATFINPLGEFSGTNALREHLATVIQEKITFDLDNFRVCDGRVVYSYVVFVDGESVEVGDGGLTIVQDGLVVFDGTVETER